MKRTNDVGGGPAAKRPAQSGPPGGAAAAGRLTTNDALTYLRDVKNKFSDRKEVYDQFLEIMKDFKSQRIDTTGVIQRVKQLFKGHRELILGFNTFLPKGCEIQVHEVDEDERKEAQPKVQIEFDQAITYVNKIKQRFSNDERVYKAFLEILNMYRKGQKTINEVYSEVAVLFRNHRDLLHEFSYFLPDNSQPQPQQQPRGWAGGRGGRGGGGMGRGYPAGGGYGYGYGGGGYGGAGHKRKASRPGEHDDAARHNALQAELQYFEKVKARLRNKDTYQDLLKTLNMYASDIINRSELLSLAQDILGGFPDLMSGFRQFLQRMEAYEGFEADLKTIAAPGGRLNPRDIQRLRAGAGRDRWMNKPISEIAADMANEDKSDRCTDSYVKYPPQLPKLTCGGRDDLCNEVLNDTWVSIVSGSEDYSFKLMRKNQYEEALFRCEDDRYELDMAIIQNRATIDVLKPLAERLAAMPAEERAQYRLPDDLLRAVHYRAIERIYGEVSGPQICDLLRRNPLMAAPVIVGRLEQKDAEWREVREEMNKLWRRVFEQNYNKSLDHRSFYFKQADKKALLTKAMLQEVKDSAEKRRAADDSLRSLAAGCPVSATLAADLAYDYEDLSVLEDVYQVVAYAIEDMLTGDSRPAAIRFWTRFVEPLFGLPRRAYSQLHTKSEPEVHHDAPSSSSDEGATTTGAGRRGRTTGLTTAEGTPEPGATPEPGDADADEPLSALLAAAGGAAAAGGGGGGRRGGRGRRRGGSGDDGSGGGGAEAADEEEEEDRLYERCKPVASRLNPASDAAAPPAGDAADAPDWARRRVLYGNDALYYFLRFHHHLCDRMLAARRCAAGRNAPTSLFRQQTAADREAASSAEAAAEAARLHGEFMAMLRRLIDGSLDASSFEDQTRTLLGTGSYVLFTLDKLVYKLVKHMQAMVADEQTMRLCELHRYEVARKAPLAEEVYRANANLLMADDANCYRFELERLPAGAAMTAAATAALKQEQDAAAAAAAARTPPPPDANGAAAAAAIKQEPGALRAVGGAAAVAGAGGGVALSIQLVDPDRVETHAPGLDATFGDYMRDYMAAPAPPGAATVPAGEGRIYLPRSARRGGGGAGGDSDLMAALGRVRVANGLECKISCSNSRVSYVLDTEDVLWRPPAGGKDGVVDGAAAGGGAGAAARGERYAAWLAAREAAIGGAQAYTSAFPEPMAQG